MLILGLSPLSALACNVLRLVPTVWLYGHVQPDAAEMFHDYSGWLMLPIAFGVVMLPIWGLRRLLHLIAPAAIRTAQDPSPLHGGA